MVINPPKHLALPLLLAALRPRLLSLQLRRLPPEAVLLLPRRGLPTHQAAVPQLRRLPAQQAVLPEQTVLPQQTVLPHTPDPHADGGRCLAFAPQA